jgi:hypothetical protein
MAWSRFVPAMGYRGGMTVSGNILFLTMSSGDLVMINAKTGDLIKDFYIGGPLNVLTSVGATASGQMELIVPITAGIVSWGTGVPGDIVALTLQNVPTGPATTTVNAGGVTTTVTIGGATSTITGPTTTATVTASVTSTGGSSSALYGVAAVAVIFIIATGYLAMKGRKPASS